MSPPRALIATTSHSALGSTRERTGVWLTCLATAYWGLRDAGLEVDLASMDGGVIPIDERSQEALGSNAQSVERLLLDASAKRAMRRSLRLSDIDPCGYRAVVLPGGHGCLWDQANDAALGRALEISMAQGAVVAAMCHGVAGLLSPTPSGLSLLRGRSITAFSVLEEQTVGLDTVVPFLLEAALRKHAAEFRAGQAFQSFALRDNKLITGQNPASAAMVVELMLAALAAPRTASPRRNRGVPASSARGSPLPNLARRASTGESL
jgi:putative intracellular protease/amidase